MGIVGLIISVLIFWPRVTLEYGEPVDPENSLSATFTVVNSTFIVPLQDVAVKMGVCQIMFGSNPLNLRGRCNNSDPITWSKPEWYHHRLTADERYGISFGDLINPGPGAKLSGADVSVVVTYQWWFIPIKCRKVYRFVTRVQSDGKLHWYSQPLDEGL
jgi:hypothetical protein